MSNANFDALDRALRIANAKDAVNSYTTAARQPNLTEADKAFLARAIAASKAALARLTK